MQRKLVASSGSSRRWKALTNCERETVVAAMSVKLDERSVKALVAPLKGAISVWDDDITGFGLRVFAPTRRHPDGARSFFINYRVSGVERRHTIASFPDCSARPARDEARALRKRIDRGEDPASDRREAPTVTDL